MPSISIPQSPAPTQSSSSPPSTVSLMEELPDTSVPSQSSSPHASLPSPIALDQFPGTYCRIPETNTLHFVLPIRDFIECTEPGCGGKFISLKWSKALTSVTRHLRGVHSLPEPQIQRWCGICKTKVPPIISRHNCLKADYYKIPKDVINSQGFNYKCMCCDLTFPSATGLSNHSRAHNRQDKYKEVNASTLKESLKAKKLIPHELLPDPNIEEHNNAALRSPSPTQSTATSSSSPACSRTDPLSDEEAVLDSPIAPTPPNNNEEIVTRVLNNPDDPPPSHKFYLQFQQILNSDELPVA